MNGTANGARSFANGAERCKDASGCEGSKQERRSKKEMVDR